MKKRNKIIVAILGILIIIRMALPSIVKDILNNKLAELEGYSGTIEDVDLALYRGGYSINGLVLFQDGMKEKPLLEINNIDLSLEWKSIFKGSVVGTVVLLEPKVNLIQSKNEGEENNYEGVEEAGIGDILSEFFPLKINTLEIENSTILYTEKDTETIFDVAFNELNATVKNITNSLELSDTKVASYEMNAKLQNHAPTYLKGTFDPYDKDLTFDVDFKLEELKLTSLNGFFKEYMNVDAEKGKFQLYSEVKSDSGKAEGYIKPLIIDSQFLSVSKGDSSDNLLQKVYEGAIGGASKLIQNPREQQIATKIEFTGNLDDPNIKTIKSVISLMKNTLIDALEPRIENILNN